MRIYRIRIPSEANPEYIYRYTKTNILCCLINRERSVFNLHLIKTTTGGTGGKIDILLR